MQGRDWRPTLRQANLSGPDRDIIVLATPEMAELSAWIIALVAAGGLAAALSTASGLLLVISSAVAHDVYARMMNPGASEKNRLLVGRSVIGVAVVIAGVFGHGLPTGANTASRAGGSPNTMWTSTTSRPSATRLGMRAKSFDVVTRRAPVAKASARRDSSSPSV